MEAALNALAASAEPTNKALKKDDLTKHRKEVIALLLLQDGRLAGSPVLNQLVAEARVGTMGAKARRTAQGLASVFNAAKASGSAALEKVKTTDQAVDCIRAGVSGAGPFAKTMFKVTEDDATIKTALAYLAFDAQRGLIYEPTAVLENDAQQVPAPPASDAVAMVGEQLKIMAEMEAQRPPR